MSRSHLRRGTAAVAIVAAVATAVAIALSGAGSGHRGGASAFRSSTESRLAEHREALLEAKEKAGGSAAQDYANRAYPRSNINPSQVTTSRAAFNKLKKTAGHGAATPKSAATASFVPGSPGTWTELGPFTPTVDKLATYTNRATTNSGRVTAQVLDPACVPGVCRMWVGAAGGGVWRTANALAPHPTWVSSSAGLNTNAIGSLYLDPNDATHNTIYVGTGEPNGSGDSEAGTGLFKSTDGGANWSLVGGSVAARADGNTALGASVASIAVEPGNANHLLMGTAVARHGSSSVNGGRRTPPGVSDYGVWESTDGGASFARVLTLPKNPAPASTGVNWFQGGFTNIKIDPLDGATVYASGFGYGAWRRSPALDGDTAWHQVFATFNSTDTFGDRTEIDLVVRAGHTRVYLGDSSDDLSYAAVWRVDNAALPAASLLTGGTNGGWTRLSSPTPGTPGNTSWDYCGGQCGYDMPIVADQANPDIVAIGGQMNYDEIFGQAPPRSNGRTVMRSVDGGVTFTDMTRDLQSPAEGLHPDQHGLSFGPNGVLFSGSDGGVERSSGPYVDESARCTVRGLAGTDLALCQLLLSKIPTLNTPLNDGLRTIQFQSLSTDAAGNLQGGTQDNGTWEMTPGDTSSWFESVGGDGGQSGFNSATSTIRMHNYYDATPDVNFHGSAPSGWDWIGDPLQRNREARSFYIPFVADPNVSGTWYAGLEHIWRTRDNGGSQAQLDAHCNEYTYDATIVCGDWEEVGAQGEAGMLTSAHFGQSRKGDYVVATEVAPSNSNVLWAATRTGRLFVSTNALDRNRQVRFTRIDSASTPGRFVSGIAIDPANPYHAFISYTGYTAYAAGGHVYEATYNRATGTASFVDRSYDLGDVPVLDIVYQASSGDLYASTDWGVVRLAQGTTSWTTTSGLPPVASYGLTLSSDGQTVYAATHGRGAWKLPI